MPRISTTIEPGSMVKLDGIYEQLLNNTTQLTLDFIILTEAYFIDQ